MDLFTRMGEYGYGETHVAVDKASGLRAIVAIHDSTLGPALGGCRFVTYASEGDAFTDALRLARGMTYKAAITGLSHGGGKSVILRPEGDFDRAALFTAFGRFVEGLGGRYITAEDSGTGVGDMQLIRAQTRHVTGVDVAAGGSGDPSPFTALGVRRGIEAAAKHKFGRSDLQGLKVAVQGVGHVGYMLCKELHALGATLFVADIDDAKSEAAVREFGAKKVALTDVASLEVDVYAPCALGGAINDETLAKLRAKVVAGAANNQLWQTRHGDELHARGVLYAPDYAINAGGLVNVAQEARGYNASAATEKTLKIFDTMAEIFERSAKSGIATYRVADTMAEEALAKARN